MADCLLLLCDNRTLQAVIGRARDAAASAGLGFRVGNPRFAKPGEVQQGVTELWISSGYSEIAAAYSASGARVVALEGAQPVGMASLPPQQVYSAPVDQSEVGAFLERLKKHPAKSPSPKVKLARGKKHGDV